MRGVAVPDTWTNPGSKNDELYRCMVMMLCCSCREYMMVKSDINGSIDLLLILRDQYTL
jgi:hypothetical protein